MELKKQLEKIEKKLDILEDGFLLLAKKIKIREKKDNFFKTAIDNWVKFFNKEMNDMGDATIENVQIINENIDNINHNYELIYNLKDQIEELKQEQIDKITSLF